MLRASYGLVLRGKLGTNAQTRLGGNSRGESSGPVGRRMRCAIDRDSLNVSRRIDTLPELNPFSSPSAKNSIRSHDGDSLLGRTWRAP